MSNINPSNAIPDPPSRDCGAAGSAPSDSVPPRVERLEELAMYTDREQEELRLQIAEVLARLSTLTRRLERLETSLAGAGDGLDSSATDADNAGPDEPDHRAF